MKVRGRVDGNRVEKKLKKGAPLTMSEALYLEGIDAARLAKILAREIKFGKEPLKAVDMAMKVRGDYKMRYIHEGVVDHVHSPTLNTEDREKRLAALAARERISNEEKDIIDLIAVPQKAKEPAH